MKIIPQPLSVLEREGKSFVFNQTTTRTCGEFEGAFVDFDKFFEGWSFEGVENTTNEIKLVLAPNLGEEEYTLDICEKGALITASNAAGAFYGLESLKQLIVEYNNLVPNCAIKDKPRFGYRAFMLDVGRYFYSVEDIKRYIDLMAAHKMNYFHWHLTEDQGFRIEIKKYPLLTSKGSKRSHTNFNIFKSHEGFYTQEEVKDVVKYCHERHVKVIPEFDIPGHCVAAISAYPYLSCFPRKLAVATHWGVKHDILCAGKAATYEFVHDVIDEMCELFPDEYFHIGGDEAVKMRWKICPDCQAKIKEWGLRNEEDLQQVFMSEIHKYLLTKGKKSVMWNWDIADDITHLDKGIIWQYTGALDNDLIPQQINEGRSIIISTCFANYLDFPFGYYNMETTCKNPLDSDKIDSQHKANVIGVEAPLWTEYVPGRKRADFLTFPRLGAIAEEAWSPQEALGFDKFMLKLDNYYKFLDNYQVGYANKRQIMPSKLSAFCTSLWFNKRVLHWQGLHNLIDDAIVKAKFAKKKTK